VSTRHDERLTLGGLRLASSQTMGAVRIVPIVRDDPPGDLRIGSRTYGKSVGIVGIDARPEELGVKYITYIPHGFVVTHSEDGSEVAFGTSLGDAKPTCVRLHHRMVKAEARPAPNVSAFRLLPLHLALEGYLALHFSGPTTLWSEYSEHARCHGLDPRFERAVRGTWIPGLAHALATFEIHPHQVGVLVFVAEALATAFVVSHPDDYRRLHRSLLEDFFGDLLYTYAMLHADLPRTEARLAAERVASFDDLAREMDVVRASWKDHADLLAGGLFGREVSLERMRDAKAGGGQSFVLERFLPRLDPNEECHIGERIVRSDGTLEYLKTFRLSHAQVRRAYLLEQLAAAEWNLDGAAERLRTTKRDVMDRLVHAGFGYLLKPHLVRGLVG
jgi:hypothetical protein